jgi:hypothetical protein
MARVYAHFMGGSVQWSNAAGATAVTIKLPIAGFTF